MLCLIAYISYKFHLRKAKGTLEIIDIKRDIVSLEYMRVVLEKEAFLAPRMSLGLWQDLRRRRLRGVFRLKGSSTT